jgi:hypothetical protein
MEELHYTCHWGTGKKWGKYVTLSFLIQYPNYSLHLFLSFYAHSLFNSKPTETGMSRLALSDADKEVRDWFVQAVKAQGCKVTIDSMGNIFAVRKGLNDGPPTCAGSHLDTQPAGGRYDGILGVTAAVEMLKVLNDNWVETEYDGTLKSQASSLSRLY